MTRPRLLLVKHRLPAPVEIGSDAVSFGLIQCLRRAYALTIVSVREGARTRDGAAILAGDGVTVRLVDPDHHRLRLMPILGKVVTNATRLFARVPREYQLTSCRALGAAIDEETRGGDVALAQLEYWTTGRYRGRAHCRAALLNHDVWFHTLEELAGHAASPRRRRVWRLEARTTRRYETSIQHAFDHRLFLTDTDREHMSRAASLADRAATVPLALPFAAAERPARGNGDEPCVLHLGSMSAPFNVDAVTFFAREVWSLVRQSVPRARFVIAGRDPGPETERLSALPGVQVTGFVADLPELLARTDLFVVPARIGSGIKVKVARALAAGLPVVGTRKGLSGYPLGPGLRQTDGTRKMADEVVALLGDAPARRRAGEENLALYRASLSVEGAARRVLSFYGGLVASAGGG